MIRTAFAMVALLTAGVAAASEIELRHGQDVLSGGLPRWRETSLRAAWSPSARAGAAASVTELERYGLRDWGLGVSAHAPVGDRWDLGLETSASGTHHVIPAWSAGARAQYVLGRGFVAGTGLRGSRYESREVSTAVGIGDVGVEYYRGAYRVAWTTYVSRVHTTWSASHALAWDVFFRGRDRVGFVLSAGRELESLGGGRVLAMDVASAALVGRKALATGWSVTYGLEVQRQADLYSRSGGRIGLVREF